MQSLSFLRGRMSDHTIGELAGIFDRAGRIDSENTVSLLKTDLMRVLQQEKSSLYNLLMWEVSPSGNYMIVVAGDLCLLVTIMGMRVLFSNTLFEEGELALEHFRWSERDYCVEFDRYYIVHDKSERYRYYFGPDRSRV